jgi:hypothetical protein
MLNAISSAATAVTSAVTSIFSSQRPTTFDVKEFENVVFTKDKLLAHESEVKYKFALRYCRSIQQGGADAILFFNEVISEKKTKILRQIEEDRSINPLKRKLQFSFRFLPFLVMLLFSEGGEVNCSCAEILFENFLEAFVDPAHTCKILEEFYHEFSETVKTSVIAALEDILFPNIYSHFKNRYWSGRFQGFGETKYLQIYLVYLMILKCWNYSNITTQNIRNFFLYDRGVRINKNHKVDEVYLICMFLLSLNKKFSFKLTGLDEISMFRLVVEMYEAWKHETSMVRKYDRETSAFFILIFEGLDNDDEIKLNKKNEV